MSRSSSRLPAVRARTRASSCAALADAAHASVRVLGPEEEGRLSYFGVLAGLDEMPESIAVCDLGGGSTELVVGTPAGPAWERSIDLGAVRLTHRLDLDDPPGKRVLPAAREEAHRMITDLTPPLAKAAYVTGGTARALRKVAGRRLGAKQLERVETLLCQTLVRGDREALRDRPPPRPHPPRRLPDPGRGTGAPGNPVRSGEDRSRGRASRSRSCPSSPPPDFACAVEESRLVIERLPPQ